MNCGIRKETKQEGRGKERNELTPLSRVLIE
jgi:hypothetical protein